MFCNSWEIHKDHILGLSSKTLFSPSFRNQKLRNVLMKIETSKHDIPL